MSCTAARRRMRERELRVLGAEPRAALELHLDRCPSCAAEARIESGISSALALLRELEPAEIDVRARVLRDLVSLQPAERAEVGGRQLAGAALLAAAGGIGLLAWLWGLWPDAVVGLRTAGSAASALGRALRALGAALLPVAAVLAEIARAAVEALRATEPLLRAAAPAVTAALLAAGLAMAATIAVTVGRDLMRPAIAAPRKELPR